MDVTDEVSGEAAVEPSASVSPGDAVTSALLKELMEESVEVRPYTLSQDKLEGGLTHHSVHNTTLF